MIFILFKTYSVCFPELQRGEANGVRFVSLKCATAQLRKEFSATHPYLSFNQAVCVY